MLDTLGTPYWHEFEVSVNHYMTENPCKYPCLRGTVAKYPGLVSLLVQCLLQAISNHKFLRTWNGCFLFEKNQSRKPRQTASDNKLKRPTIHNKLGKINKLSRIIRDNNARLVSSLESSMAISTIDRPLSLRPWGTRNSVPK